MKKFVIKILISLLVTGVLFFLFAWGMGVFKQDSTSESLKILSNSAFVIGALMTAVGLLVVMSGQGAYDSISYSVQKALSILPYVNKSMPKTLYDYKKEKQEKQATNKGSGVGFVLIVGIIWIAVAVVFMLIY